MTVLVTAATGKVGREVTAQLRARDVELRAGSRRSTLPLDWSDPSTWSAVLDGVDRVFLIVPGGDDGNRSVTGLGNGVVEFIDLAQRRGVERVVLMTALGMEYAPIEVEQRAVELHLQRSDLAWTILRPNWFLQNLTHGPLRILADAHDGVLRLPTGDSSVSFIDTRDIATVAVEALLSDHHGHEYALTGPQSLTFNQVAEACRDSPVPVAAYEPVSEADFRRAVLNLGWHPDYVNTLSGLFATIAAGRAAPVLPDAAEVLGRTPRSLAEFLQEVR
ncbi:NAD(P)H-binding protein [Dietzia timorensis]|uniref:Prestalk A differentiation protein A n=1 Tax=Dietzia timorensis TaxID=499555 RepID=A0A173LF06_9ACTN|nr:NAD(P)H-binding protein [Dietzia timorensis]ANI90866.1 Prestalk A differentiation protein A [Dietzia timorensis]